MQIVVISPESPDSREAAAMGGMFSAGLGRYHVRKPSWTEDQLGAWLLGLPQSWRPRIVLHQHHALVGRLGLGGSHERDAGGAPDGTGHSRSCHDLPSLRACLGRYDYVTFGPVFPSLTKAGYGPARDFPWDRLKEALHGDRGPAETRVLAIGGITAQGLARCRDLGFDGAAAMGAVWRDSDPVRAFVELAAAARKLGEARRAA